MYRKHWIAALVATALFQISKAAGKDYSTLYPVGSGSKFSLSLGDAQEIDLAIYVSESSRNKVGIETYFRTIVVGAPVEMWQQSAFTSGAQGNPELRDTLLFTSDMKAPERIPISAMRDGDFEIRDFLFTDGKAIEKYKVGVERVRVEAGEVSAVHYRISKGKSTIDFWVSDEAKPIGLVKLAAKGKTSFELGLKSLINNVKRKIDPKQATALSARGKEMLAIPAASALLN